MVSDNKCFDVSEARQLISDPRYNIEEFVGSGAMACVYKVSERGTPNIYALKLLREPYRQREQFVEIFQREAQHMRDLQYPNIVRFYKFVNEARSAYILMDYVEGKPLTHYIREARRNKEFLPLPMIVRIMAQIARAISYLHTEGYIHRDIKPGNVLLMGEEEGAFLTDLGIAGAFNEQALSGAGTPSYMPYEQQMQMDIDQTVDIYAFGIMLYEMFLGTKPFVPSVGLSFNEARNAIITLHEKAPVPSLSAERDDLPPEIDDYFRQALAKKPEDRYRDIMDFVQDIHEALLPQLPDDLKDFESIRPQEMVRSATVDTGNVPVANSSQVILGGLIAIGVIALFVILGIWYNDQLDTGIVSLGATAASELVDTSSQAIAEATEEMAVDTPSETPVITTTDAATEEVTNPTATETEASQPESIGTATPQLFGIPRYGVLEGSDAIGLGDDMDVAARYLSQQGDGYIPLRLGQELNGFEVSLTLNEDTLDDYESYGVVFRVQDATTFLRFVILPQVSEWTIEQVVGDTVRVLRRGEVNIALPTEISVRGQDTVIEYTYDTISREFEFTEWQTGGVGLWLPVSAEQEIDIEDVEIGLVGDDAINARDTAPTDVPELNPIAFVLEDVQALRETGAASAIVQCPQFLAIYDALSLHLELEEIAPFAQEAQSLSAFIYNRCLTQGQTEAVDFNNSFTDYLNWETAIETLISEIEGAQ